MRAMDCQHTLAQHFLLLVVGLGFLLFNPLDNTLDDWLCHLMWQAFQCADLLLRLLRSAVLAQLLPWCREYQLLLLLLLLLSCREQHQLLLMLLVQLLLQLGGMRMRCMRIGHHLRVLQWRRGPIQPMEQQLLLLFCREQHQLLLMLLVLLLLQP